MKQFIFTIIASGLMLQASLNPVWADSETRECTTSSSSYGSTTTTCKDLVTGQTTQVVDVIKDTGLAQVNFWVVAGSLVLASGIFYLIAKVAQRIYWFE